MAVSITREQAAAALHSKLKSLSSEGRQAAVDDSATGYGPDLDDALRRMELDDVTALDSHREIAAFLIIARYYGLVRLGSLLATKVDTEGYAVDGDRETIFDNVMDLKAAANKEALAYGYVLEVSDLDQTGDANLPIDQTEGVSAWSRDRIPTDYLAVYPYYAPDWFLV